VSTLRVRRLPDGAGILRRISIEVDGHTALRVGHDKTVELEVEPGQHSVQARMDWHSSPVLNVTVMADETTDVQVSYSFTAITKLFKRTDEAIDIKQV
jgi:hypothetical protein